MELNELQREYERLVHDYEQLQKRHEIVSEAYRIKVRQAQQQRELLITYAEIIGRLEDANSDGNISTGNLFGNQQHTL